MRTLALGACGEDRLFGPLVVAAEVQPPQAAGDDECEAGRDEQGGVECKPRGADADRDDRLAEHDDQQQSVALHEVASLELKARWVGGERGHDRESEGGRPRDVHGRLGEEARGEDDRCAHEVEQSQPAEAGHAAAQPRAHEEPGVDEDDRHEPDAEHDASAGEGRRDRQRHDQETDHRRQQEQLADRSVRRNRIRQPHVAAEHPPQDAEQQEDPQHADRRRVVGQDGGQLGDGEDEDEVEEQLERRDRSALRLDRQLGRHRSVAHRNRMRIMQVKTTPNSPRSIREMVRMRSPAAR